MNNIILIEFKIIYSHNWVRYLELAELILDYFPKDRENQRRSTYYEPSKGKNKPPKGCLYNRFRHNSGLDGKTDPDKEVEKEKIIRKG